MIDISDYYKKLVNKESLCEGEVVALLEELKHFRRTTAYLASCQAATLQSLSKTASKASRKRHVSLCLSAAKFLNGDGSDISHLYGNYFDAARERCLNAASRG